MLFKISLKNIRKSLKDYTVYFFTLILGVAIFYVFNAIDSQSVMLDVRANVMDIIKLMNSDHEIVCDQKVRLSYDLHDSAKDLIHRLHKQTHHNKIQRKQRQDQKAFLF